MENTTSAYNENGDLHIAGDKKNETILKWTLVHGHDIRIVHSLAKIERRKLYYITDKEPSSLYTFARQYQYIHVYERKQHSQKAEASVSTF